MDENWPLNPGYCIMKRRVRHPVHKEKNGLEEVKNRDRDHLNKSG